jgi:hypothetical protein
MKKALSQFIFSFHSYKLVKAVELSCAFVIVLNLGLTLQADAQDPWMIKDVNPTNSVSPVYVNILNNGTVIGTNSSAIGDNSPSFGMYTVNGNVLFFGTDGTNTGIFKTDGTQQGTAFVSALPLTNSTDVSVFNTGNILYVQVNFGDLYSTDGTSSGSYMIYNNQTQGNQYGTVSVNQNPLSCYYKGNFFFITDGGYVFETNGTASGTSILSQITTFPSSIAAFNNKLYYLSNPGDYLTTNPDLNLYSYDLTTSQVAVVADLSVAGNDSTAIGEMVNLNDNYLLINGNFGGVNQVLSLSTGSTSPTILLNNLPNPAPAVGEIAPGATLLYGSNGGADNSPVIYNNSLFFQVVSGLTTTGNATYRTAVTNGTLAGTFDLGFNDSNLGTGYCGMITSGMIFYDDSNVDTAKIYVWNGAAPNSYKLLTAASDSLTSAGNAAGVSASQFGGNIVFSSVSGGGPSIFLADTAGTYCYNVCALNVGGTGAVLNNNYIFFAQQIIGLSAGMEPHVFSPGNWSIWTGNASADWNNSSNWLNNTVPVATSSVIIPTVAKFPVVNSSAACENLVITNENYSNSPVPNVTINAPGNLSINAGYLWNSGYITGTGSLNIAGTGTGQVSTYDCSETYSYSNPHSALEVDTINIKGADMDLTNVNFASPTSGLTPLGSLDINSVINFQSNNKLIANFNTLYFGSSFLGYNSQRYILTNRNTSVNWSGFNFPLPADTIATLPMGTTRTSYTPVTITSALLYNNSDASSFQVTITDTVQNAGTSNTNYVKKTWNVVTSGLFPNNMTLGWEAGDQMAGFNGNNCYISAYSGSQWPANKLQAVKSDSGVFTAQELYGKDLNANYVVFSQPLVAPAVQANTLTVSNLTTNSTTVNWKNGNGASRAVFMSKGSPANPLPLDSTNYTASANFSTGTQIGASGWYCIYNGVDSSVNVTGLTAATSYNVMALEYNGSTGTENYLITTAAGNPLNFTTSPPSTIATLNSLLVNSAGLTSSFNPDVFIYTASVGNNIANITLTPTVTDTTATITINGIAETSGLATPLFPVAIGNNVFTIVVTAQNQTTTNTYTLTVNRVPLTNDNLSNLAANSGTLNPVFSAATLTYTDSVGYTTASLQVTPTVQDATATIKINGTASLSGTASAAIPLNVGSNTINVLVTAQDTAVKQTYTITVNRTGASNANLANLTISDGILTPAFSAATPSYTVAVNDTVSTISLTPTLSDVNASVTVNGTKVGSGSASQAIALNIGTNNITIAVTAQDGTTVKTYTLTVTRAEPVIFTLPDTNFALTATSATCNGTADGSINISAVENLNYTASVTGNGLTASYAFTTAQAINNLSAGTYQVCITVAGQSSYQQCYDMVITEPKELSLYTAVNETLNSVTLNLDGADTYNIQLNNTQYTTSQSTITLPLDKGDNSLTVSTDKICQGIIHKLINVSNVIVPYPVPFQNVLNLNLGNTNIGKVVVNITDLTYNRQVYSGQYQNQSGIIQLDVSKLNNGIYILNLSMDNSVMTFKIIKE